MVKVRSHYELTVKIKGERKAASDYELKLMENKTGEQCDNGNQTGCVNCVVVAGYNCAPVNGSSACTPLCGDGIRLSGEQCDNGNQTGCINCVVVTGYNCQPSGGGSVCTTICGDGILLAGEQCDNGNQSGCVNCAIVGGYTCSPVNTTTVCTPVCGDGIFVTGEQCDNGNQTGCINCSVEVGYSCQTVGASSSCSLTPESATTTNNSTTANPIETIQKQLQIIVPVSFVILGLMGMILFYNLIKFFRRPPTNEAMELTNQDSSVIKRITIKLDSNEVIQVKPLQ